MSNPSRIVTVDSVYVCEYSTKQRCFHIRTLRTAVEQNRNGILHDYQLDFIPFMITDDIIKAKAYCDQMQKAIQNTRREYKINPIMKPSFCVHIEKANCLDCEYSLNSKAFDPGCALKRKEGDDNEQSDDQ